MPVACQSDLLNEHEVVMGSAVFDANGVGLLLLTREMPCVASDHQLYGGRPREFSKSWFVTRVLILSSALRRETMSAARASMGAVGSQIGHAF